MSSLEVISRLLPPTTSCAVSFGTAGLGSATSCLPPPTGCGCSTGAAGSLPTTTSGAGSFHMAGMAGTSCLPLPTGCGCTTGAVGSLPPTTSGAGSFHMAGMAGTSCLPPPTGCGFTTGALDSLLSPSLPGSNSGVVSSPSLLLLFEECVSVPVSSSPLPASGTVGLASVFFGLDMSRFVTGFLA